MKTENQNIKKEDVVSFIIQNLNEKGIETNHFNENTEINNDYIDSMEVFDLGLDLDIHYDIEVQEKDMACWNSIGDVADTVIKYLQNA